MRIPYAYILNNGEFQIDEQKAEHVRMIFAYYLSGASLGKVVDTLWAKGIGSPSGNAKWTRAAIDKLLSNSKYIPVVGMETYIEVQYEKETRCNVDHDSATAPRKANRYTSPVLGGF